MSEFPWETKKREEKENHINNGYKVEKTHGGQKARYGDSFDEYTIKTDKPKIEVELYCTESVSKCGLTYDDWLTDNRKTGCTMDDHFRTSYKFKKVRDGEYFYQVIYPSTH